MVRNQPLKGNRIHQRDFFLCTGNIGVRVRIFRSSLDFREIDGLVFIVDVGMDCKLHLILI